MAMTFPGSPTDGQIYDTGTGLRYIYRSAISSWELIAQAYVSAMEPITYTATALQTDFNINYHGDYVEVFQNGLKLVKDVDFTAPDGTKIVLTVGATAGDVLDIFAFGVFNVADHYSKTEMGVLADYAKLNVAQNYTAPQKSLAHDYGTVGATKTISLADGSGQNYSLATTAATNLTLTASNFNVDNTGWIRIVNTSGETISFDGTFGGEDTQDLSAAGTYLIGYGSTSTKVVLGTAIFY